jgi:hypothetical protein
VRFSGSHGVEYEERVFWDIALCSLFGIDRRFIKEMEILHISETSVYSTTRRRNPGVSYVHDCTCRSASIKL